MNTIQPAVVIGLGGTGVKAITYLKKTLMEQSPESEKFVRFLAIDIDELKGEVPSASIFGKHISLDPEKNEFIRITDQTRGGEARNIPEISDWFPEQAYKYLPLTEGARQSKPIGRLGFFVAHELIAKSLHRLTNRLVTPEIKADFPGVKAGELNIYIVSSLCGGTGAGLLIDIAYELRYLQQQAQLPDKSRIKGLFALGDVYEMISQRVFANTYASLREINHVQKEHAAFHPVYPDGTRDLIKARAFDAFYLFSNRNQSGIEFSSPDDFAQLCAEFIFLDSGSDSQEQGNPLSAMIQSVRNNSEVYTLNHDADGSPHCYSSFGLCKIRFPAERVAELCAVRMGREVIEHHITGRLDQAEILEARLKVQEFLTNEGLGCSDDNSDLPDRLVEKRLEGGDHIPLDNWVSQNLAKAYNNDLENLKNLEIGRINQIVEMLNKEISQFQGDMPYRVIGELQTFGRLIEKAFKTMFQENLGVSFVAKFLDEMLESARLSRDYAQQEMKNLLGHEKRLSDQMNNQIREMTKLLDKSFFNFLKLDAKRTQLRETYKAIRQNFTNKIKIMKMRSAVGFYDGVHDAKQNLMEGGEGALSRLSIMGNDISLIQAFIDNQAKTFEDAYNTNKQINGSKFEIMIYDNDQFSTLDEIWESVYNDSLRAKLFDDILTEIGGSIWNLRQYMDNEYSKLALRNIFVDSCIGPFHEAIKRKTVAQRIREAKTSLINPIDYGPTLQGAYEVADYFCLLNNAAARFAGLRDSEQSVACIVMHQDEEDAAWNDVRKILQEAMGRAGSHLPFSHTSDINSILIYREYSGFPAYTLRGIGAYHNNYDNESNRDNTPPLQMLTKESLGHINVPTRPVLSKFVIMVIEAIARGIIISDDEHYLMVTEKEWKRRKTAEDLQKRGDNALIEDRTAGNHRKMGSKLSEVISLMNEKLPDRARISSSETKWEDQIQREIENRKTGLKRDLFGDLLKALYFEGYEGTKIEKINLETELRPSIAFILKRDFALREDHIFRPEDTHEKLLRKIYIGNTGK